MKALGNRPRTTECGLTWHGPTETCAQFQAAERAALAALADVPGWTRGLVCDRIYGYQIVELAPDPDAPWTGKTWCVYGTIELVQGRWRNTGTLTHELAHVVEFCLGDHFLWDERGIYAAVSRTYTGTLRPGQ
jgi:hypothetical protein